MNFGVVLPHSRGVLRVPLDMGVYLAFPPLEQRTCARGVTATLTGHDPWLAREIGNNPVWHMCCDSNLAQSPYCQFRRFLQEEEKHSGRWSFLAYMLLHRSQAALQPYLPPVERVVYQWVYAVPGYAPAAGPLYEEASLLCLDELLFNRTVEIPDASGIYGFRHTSTQGNQPVRYSPLPDRVILRPLVISVEKALLQPNAREEALLLCLYLGRVGGGLRAPRIVADVMGWSTQEAMLLAATSSRERGAGMAYADFLKEQVDEESAARVEGVLTELYGKEVVA